MSTAGTILRVDLTNGNIKKEPTTPYIKDYIGGAGIAAKIFWDEVPPDTRAFEPRNLLVFSAGTLTGTPLSNNKGEVASKSPEQVNHPYVRVGFGGQFPSEMKFAGYDLITIRGKAKEPAYMFINDDSVELRDAKHLWGLDVHQTQARIKNELGDPDIQVACIGPAGENLVVCAMIVTDIDASVSKRGMGAVMGSKNLKAIAIRGTKGLKIADPKAFIDLINEYYHDLTKGDDMAWSRMFHRENLSRMQVEGYPAGYVHDKNLVPSEVPFSPTMEFVKKYTVNHTGCAFCPLQCHTNINVPGIGSGATACFGWIGLAFAQLYDRSDYKLWWKRTVLCERYGVDHLYVEMLGSWLIDLYKNGVITAADTDGIPFVKGSEEAITALIEKLAKAEGFGKLLTDGVVPAAEKIGRGSLDFANQYGNTADLLAPGNSELNQWQGPVTKYLVGDFENSSALPLDQYAAGICIAEDLGMTPREAIEQIEEWCCKISERYANDRNVWRAEEYDKRLNSIFIGVENTTILDDITGHCQYLSDWYAPITNSFGVPHHARWLSAATGIQYTTEKVCEVAQRVRMLIHSYRILGWHMGGEEHAVSKGYKTQELPRGVKPEYEEQQRRDYCEMRGFDPVTGIPTREILEELGLKDVADKLEVITNPTAEQSLKPQKVKKSRKKSG